MVREQFSDILLYWRKELMCEGIFAKVIIDSLKTQKQKDKYIGELKESEPRVYDSYKGYIDQLDYEIIEYELDYDSMTEENLTELNGLDEYVPIFLRPLLNTTYYNGLSEKVRDEIIKSYALFKVCPNHRQYQVEELNYWLKDHQKWEKILK